MISFNLNSANQILVNPKISADEKSVLIALKNEFEIQAGKLGFFLLTSSGSSQNNNTSVKLIALSIEKVLNSARRFNQYFKASENDHWGLVLPDFHVAGLGIRARAFLADAQVFVKEWETDNFTTWIQENKIHFISLVPAQVFDLVQKKIIAPVAVKKIFVGAGSLNFELRNQALKLNWPIVETYGMTETASMIAVKEAEFFQVLPGVEVKIDLDLLSIKCDSLLTAKIQKVANQIEVKKIHENSWYLTEDRVELFMGTNEIFLKFLGRKTDYIKILGEGVSLSEIRSKLSELVLLKGINFTEFELLALEDTRAGYKLVLAVENTVNKPKASELMEFYNRACRPYEKILQCVVVRQIPRTELGKLKSDELKRIVTEELKKG